MSRASPGRYSLHDFAKNVYDVEAFGADGEALVLERPDDSGWTAARHGAQVTVRYKIYGDRVDGTYLAIDRTHLHMNMPAALMWAHGLEDRAARLTFDRPAGLDWQLATQLHPGSTPLEFTAPNLQYLMDSPVEFGAIELRPFTVGTARFRVAAHHTGSDAELDGYVADVRKIVAEEEGVYGEFPDYEPGTYTFLLDYLPWAFGDGMEHRNSTVITSRGAIATDRADLLDGVAHEFFHGWNIERIRPRSLEPFDFDHGDLSDALWLGEGFTQYYGPLALERAGLAGLPSSLDTLGALVDDVVNDPARLVRSPVQSSELAPFTDRGRPGDRTNWRTTYLSYYPFGAAVALGLDLSLRDRTDGRVTLDDYMRAMWRKYGKPGGAREGYVDHPYTIAGAEEALAEVSGDSAFASDFFTRFIEGHDVLDYRRLLDRAGLLLRLHDPGAAWWGDVLLEERGGRVRIAALVRAGTPAYAAGLEQDDVIEQMDGRPVVAVEDVRTAIGRHRPGDSLAVVSRDRAGVPHAAGVTLAADPHLTIVPFEAAGRALTPRQRTFRAAWLGSRAPQAPDPPKRP